MSRSKEAKEVFESGFNCAQSVLFTHGKEFFKEDLTALKLASGFGAGISYRGEMCGAVSGALMTIGLHYGHSDSKDDLAKELTYMITKEFTDKFEKENGSVICNKLLKTEINTDEGIEYARENGLFEEVCPKLVESSSEILEELINKYPLNKLSNNKPTD